MKQGVRKVGCSFDEPTYFGVSSLVFVASLKLFLTAFALIVLVIISFFAVFDGILCLAVRAIRVICVFSHSQT